MLVSISSLKSRLCNDLKLFKIFRPANFPFHIFSSKAAGRRTVSRIRIREIAIMRSSGGATCNVVTDMLQIYKWWIDKVPTERACDHISFFYTDIAPLVQQHGLSDIVIKS
jgi:hypothetical protein